MKYLCKFIFLLLFLVGLTNSYASLPASEVRTQLDENVKWMNTLPTTTDGMDIVIICANQPVLAQYWEKRLQKTGPYLLSPHALVICVDEDWASGGAGNGLGTLYAYEKARAKALDQWGIDILQKQAEGAAVAIYHTAGQGKRLAPLTISESGIKSAVKLPGLILPLSSDYPDVLFMTLLEATIKQSAIFALSRKGRLSVFWSDQVFIPSKSPIYIPDSHIDIHVKRIPLPSQDSWQQQGLDNYGILAWDKSGEAELFDKCSYQTLKNIFLENETISQEDLGISMGTFSLSTAMIIALLDEFAPELNEKKVLLDSDPYFWMPLTLDLKTYTSAMHARKVPIEFIHSHYERMQNFKKRFKEKNPTDLKFFGAVDIGRDSYWWDYGTVDAYYRNNIKMTQAGDEGELMRKFYHIEKIENSPQTEVNVQNSAVIGSHIKQGLVKNSLVIGVSADSIQVENSIMINSAVKIWKMNHSLAYCIQEEETTHLEPHYVRVDAFIPALSQHLKLQSMLDSDGKANWKTRLFSNIYSWEEAVELVSKYTPYSSN